MDKDLSFLCNTPLAADASAIKQLLISKLLPQIKWQQITQHYLSPLVPFNIHYRLYEICYAKTDFKPIWLPDNETKTNSYLGRWLNKLKFSDISQFYQYSIDSPQDFWGQAIADLNLSYTKKPLTSFDMSLFPHTPTWLPGACFNIADCCINVADNIVSKPAIIYKGMRDGKCIEQTMNYAELQDLVHTIATGFKQHYQLNPKDTVAIIMPMNIEAVATYLAVIYLGASVVSIADSFSESEIDKRLSTSNCKLVVTQDVITRGNKTLKLYQKIMNCQVSSIICLNTKSQSVSLRANDMLFDDLLNKNNSNITPTPYLHNAQGVINILFSSGTTGTAKAIVWEQSTALKVATDAKLYMDTNEEDIWAWPTSLGWMMGPWLVFTVFLNRATMALTEDLSTSLEFAQFIERTQVTKLGVIPSIVNAWHKNAVLEQVNWQHIKLFASTGEASNVEDMFYLSLHAHYKPIIEYCGGTEIGGAYISSTLLQANAPAQFSQVCFGIELILLDENQKILLQSGKVIGEAALSSCALGLSNRLLNADNNDIYYNGMPLYNGKPLRRHGDLLKRSANGYYHSLGRADNTMNLGGIKTSSAEIEQVLLNLEGIYELAAVAVNNETKGISKLVIYVVPMVPLDICQLKIQMQALLKEYLNPLFKINDVILIEKLPRTASNKVIHRELKAHYAQYCQNSTCC
ncbi:AMP-binding protein [Cysteiniphilum halobium]|uniref:AMP-binding protein n=1 Tax=Cysteiniphilum halobium TaxID=2219059 RepID=UPI000E646279|nr:AMP-binding protein [Cysteiniphilum halobium]